MPRLDSRPFRVHVKRYGHFGFDLPVISPAHAREVLKRWQDATGMTKDEAVYPHGVLSTKSYDVIEEWGFV